MKTDPGYAECWFAVCNTLRSVRPHYMERPDSGRECAVLAIKELAQERNTLRSALQALEQAYANRHSPQHRSACLIHARAALKATEAPK
jgi:hypothetical protein